LTLPKLTVLAVLAGIAVFGVAAGLACLADPEPLSGPVFSQGVRIDSALIKASAPTSPIRAQGSRLKWRRSRMRVASYGEPILRPEAKFLVLGKPLPLYLAPPALRAEDIFHPPA
jgi:hypothetical protein